MPDSSIARSPEPPALEIPLPPREGEDAPTIDSMARSSLSRSSPRTLSPRTRSAPERPPGEESERLGEESERPELLFEATLPFPTPVSEADDPFAVGVEKIESAPSSRISWSSSVASPGPPAGALSRTSSGRSRSSSPLPLPEPDSSPRVRNSRSTSSVLNLFVTPSRIGNSFLRSTSRLTSSTETPRSRAASSGDMNLPAMAALTGAGTEISPPSVSTNPPSKSTILPGPGASGTAGKSAHGRFCPVGTPSAPTSSIFFRVAGRGSWALYSGTSRSQAMLRVLRRVREPVPSTW